MGDVVWLQHLGQVLARVRTEICLRRTGTNERYANVVPAQLFCGGNAETVQTPFRRRVGGAIRERILASDGGDIDDVAATAPDHARYKGRHAVVHAAQVGVEDRIPLFRWKSVQRTAKVTDTSIIYQYIN